MEKIIHSPYCAVHNPDGAPVVCDCGAAIKMALQKASLALSASHNVMVTDRPDWLATSDVVWTTDHAEEIAAIDEAMKSANIMSDEASGSRLYWQQGGEEEPASDTLYDALVYAADGYAASDFPMTFTFDVARREPSVRVVVSGVDEDGNLEYDVVEEGK